MNDAAVFSANETHSPSQLAATLFLPCFQAATSAESQSADP
jgi:hypothetical protein